MHFSALHMDHYTTDTCNQLQDKSFKTFFLDFLSTFELITSVALWDSEQFSVKSVKSQSPVSHSKV